MAVSLNPSELAELEKMLGGDDPTPSVSTPEPVVQARAETVHETNPVETRDDSPVDQSEDFRAIPYNRFKEVNTKYQAEKARAEELAAKLAAFERSPKVEESEDAWIDKILGNETTKPTQDDVPEWAKSLQAMKAEIEADKAQLLLDRALAQAAKDYPDIPQAVVLGGLANGNTMEDIANSWDWMGKQYLASQDKRAGSNIGSDPKSNVAPRLPASRGKMNAPEPPAHGKTWSENSKRVQEWFKTQG